jgi:hypothetical protein
MSLPMDEGSGGVLRPIPQRFRYAGVNGLKAARLALDKSRRRNTYQNPFAEGFGCTNPTCTTCKKEKKK